MVNFSDNQPVRLKGYISLRIFLPALLILGAMGIGSCGGGGDSGNGQDYTPPSVCNLDSQRNEHRLYLEGADKGRDYYYPKRFSRDFKENYGADISPTQRHRDIAKKLSRSVFDMEFRRTDSPVVGIGTGWLIAPEYVVTAAHAFIDNSTFKEKNIGDVFIHTFDGDRIKVVQRAYVDERVTSATDLALLRLEKEIDAVPLKIADKVPEKNDFLMAMGVGFLQRGIGGWTVSAGPALGLESGYPISRPDRMYHVVPTSEGMSGGPIFNEDGEVVSIVSQGGGSEGTVRNGFGVMPFEDPEDPVEDLWVYAFEQPDPHAYSLGPNINELKRLYEMIPDSEKPHNAGDYSDKNSWKAAHELGNNKFDNYEFGDKYSPFPLDQFDPMNEKYKKAREGTVIIKISEGGSNSFGSGFIYNENTIVTVGHLGTKKGLKAEIKTYDGKEHYGEVEKTQDSGLGGCDIAVIRMDEPLSEYHSLEIADKSPSPKCGDPLVAIGSGGKYNSVGRLQGVGAVYMHTETYVSEFISHFTVPGMSGGPVIDRNGKVISLNSTTAGGAREEGEEIQGRWIEPGPLIIRTRLPVYVGQDFSEGPNAETLKRFVTENNYRCPE